MKFSYQIKDSEGHTFAGYLESASQESALAFLQGKGYFVVSLEKENLPFYKRKISLGWISFEDILNFTIQLSVLFKSSVPLVESLKTIASMSANSDFKQKILKMSEKVEGGSPLSVALAEHPRLFSRFYVNMVKAGEASGRLSENLDALAIHLANEKELKDKILGAMAYPVFIMAVFAIVLFMMAKIIIPQFRSVIEGYGSAVKIPTLTKIIFAISDFLLYQGFWLVLSLIALGVFAWRYGHSKEGKNLMDKMILRAPVIGNLVKKIQVATFAESLSTLISAGIPISQALEITSDVLSNNVFRDIALDAREKVMKGSPMSFVLSKYSEEIPSLLTQMAVVGERTGSLESSLQKVVDFYRKEVYKTTDNAIELIQPVLLLVMGVLVGFLVVGIYMPIISMSSGQ